MGKVFGLLMLVVSMWVGLEIYTEGFDHAFGGKLAFMSSGEEAPEAGQSMTRRVGERAEAAAERGVDRLERQLGDLGD